MTITTVLVADDEMAVRTPICEFLRHAGFTVVEASNGEMAVTLAIEHQPDVVLLDVVMPVMTGIEATSALRQMPQLAEVPIIVMSGSPSPSIRDAAFSAGCSEYLQKPYSPMALVAVVSHWARLRSEIGPAK